MTTRIIKPTEKTSDKYGRTIRPGDILTHPRFGRVQLDRVDNTTYSIDMVVVNIINERSFKGRVTRSAVEFTKLG